MHFRYVLFEDPLDLGSDLGPAAGITTMGRAKKSAVGECSILCALINFGDSPDHASNFGCAKKLAVAEKSSVEDPTDSALVSGPATSTRGRAKKPVVGEYLILTH